MMIAHRLLMTTISVDGLIDIWSWRCTGEQVSSGGYVWDVCALPRCLRNVPSAAGPSFGEEGQQRGVDSSHCQNMSRKDGVVLHGRAGLPSASNRQQQQHGYDEGWRLFHASKWRVVGDVSNTCV